MRYGGTARSRNKHEAGYSAASPHSVMRYYEFPSIGVPSSAGIRLDLGPRTLNVERSTLMDIPSQVSH